MHSTSPTIAPRLPRWRDRLRRLESRPLAFCPAFPEIAARWRAWWRFEADRPLIIASTAANPSLRWDKALDLLDEPDAWLAVRRAQVEATHWAGEALPFVRVDIGPVATAAFLGAPLHLALSEQTSWQEPIIDNWAYLPALDFDPENMWLLKVLRLMKRLVEDARGRYLVCLPDLTGAIDVLANLRTPERLCMDVLLHREAVIAAAARVVDAWEAIFCSMYNLILEGGAGVTQWVSCWADGPFTVPTCDFNALISPPDFAEVCLPSLNEQAGRAGLCVFHLDGPEAARHGTALAEAKSITAVQYTPGAGTPSAMDMLPLLRMFQEHGVPLFVETPAREVRPLARALDPRGTALRISDAIVPEEADALVDWRDAHF